MNQEQFRELIAMTRAWSPLASELERGGALSAATVAARVGHGVDAEIAAGMLRAVGASEGPDGLWRIARPATQE